MAVQSVISNWNRTENKRLGQVGIVSGMLCSGDEINLVRRRSCIHVREEENYKTSSVNGKKYSVSWQTNEFNLELIGRLLPGGPPLKLSLSPYCNLGNSSKRGGLFE